MVDTSLNIFEKTLSVRKLEAAPIEWASARNSLGYALVAIEQSDSDIAALKQSIDAIKNELQGCNPEDSLEKWITLQTRYSAALHALGQRDADDTVSLLNEAMEAYKSILPFIKRQESPLQWALLLDNIARVFQDLGEYSKGTRTLERSISAYNNALTQRTSDDAPLEWAMSHNNAAVAMQILSEIKQDVDILKESVVSYGNANQKLTQEEHPLAWVITTCNLGSARIILAEQVKDIEIAKQAVDNFTDVVDYFHDVTNSQYFEYAKQYLDAAQAVLQEIG